MKISMLRPSHPSFSRPSYGVFARALCAGALAVGLIGAAQAQVSGTKNIPGDYPDLAAAITDVNTVGVGAGGVTLNVLAGNAQVAPVGGYTIATTTASASNPLAIVGNANTVTANAALVAGSVNDAIFKIVGTDNVTISGVSMQENAGNTTTTTASNNMTEFGVALFYATATDNAQNITIQNNTISLNRAYNNTFGVYANATHTATAMTTTASATGATGGNNGLKIYSNTINNVNVGIVVVGPTAAADANDGVDIGGSSLATGNTLSNYGTTTVATGYANVSSSVSGVLVRNSKNFNVSFNSIISSTATTIPTATSTGTLRAIHVPPFSIAPLGTITNSINNNTIGLRGGAVGVVLQGIIVEATTGNATTTININSNNFNDASFNLAASTGATTFISNLGVVFNSNINNNTFTNLIINSTGAVNFIVHTFTLPTGGTKNVNSNSIVTAFSKTGVGGTVTLHTDSGSSPAGTFSNNNNNNFSNITVTGTTGQAGWANLDGNGVGTVTKTVTGNTFTNWTNGGSTSAITGMSIGFGGTQIVSNNLVNTFSGGGTVTGITTASSGTSTLSLNTVHTLSSTGANNVTGMACISGTTVTLARNKIYNLTGSNASSAVFGLTVSGGTTVNVNNNIIGDLFLPNSGATNSIAGLNLSGGTTVNASYNTVRLAATSVGANFGSAAVSVSTTPTVTLRNNNFVNLSTAAGTGLTSAYRRSGTTLTSYGSTSNNNNFYAGTPSVTNVIFFDGITSDQTLAAYKGRVASRDASSVTENPPFASTTGSAATFLHINTAVATQLEGNGAAVSGITDDFDGDVRNATTPDIGADEFNGIPLDLNGPAITYTPLANTTLFTNRVLAVSIFDLSGVAGGGFTPRIYFRKGAGAYVSTQCTAGTAPNYSCTIDSALMGGVAIGDVINYFVIAQDMLGNVSASPGAGLVASDVNTVSTPPTTPQSYTIVPVTAGTINVGAGETITSLTNTGGLFAVLNASVLTSNIVVNITSDLTAETGTVVLNQLAEKGVGNYSVNIRPVGAREVRGSAVARLIDFNGADRVTIDGLNAAGNSLLIRNEGVGEIVRYINDASDNNLVNCVLEGGAGVTAVNVSTGTVTGNDNIRIAGNIVRDRTVPSAGLPFNGIGSTSAAVTGLNSNLIIENNQIINFGQAGIFIGVGSDNVTIASNQIRQTAVRATSLLGIAINGMSGNNVVRNNEIRDLETTLAAGPLTGISAGTSVGTNQYTENTIRDLRFSGTTGETRGLIIGDVRTAVFARNRIFGLQSNAAATGALIGIRYSGSSTQASNATVVNNYISLAPTAVGAFPVIGVFDFAFANNTISVDYNSIFVAGTASGSTSSWNYQRGSGTPTFSTLRNNILYNNRSGGTGSHFAIGDQSVNTGTWTSNNNVYFGNGATPASYFDLGTAAAGTPVNFATWQAGPPTRDANSVAALASSITLSSFFVDAANGNLNLLATATQAINAGTPIVGITTDIDGDVRSATAPEIGADELPSYTVGGTVSGLVGTGLVLQNNLGNNLNVSANGSFTFTQRLDSGAAYSVTVLTQPGTPTQTCAISNGSGTIGAANVTSVVVNCVTNTYTVGGSVTGLTGTGLVLRNNGGDNLPISANGAFTFATPVASGATYAVTVLTQPGAPTQTCTVSNGSGTVGAANVTNVAVSCATSTYTVGGSVTGLTGTGLVLRNNGGNNLSISANGAFTFTTPVASGATYAVTVFTQPGTPTQTCTVSNGSGTIVAANVTNVAVSCVTNTYTVGGSVTGLTGTGLVLRNNGGDSLAISANGAFTFATPVASGATYAVTVFTQPGAPTQSCAVSNGSGTIGAANVTNVVVSCSTNTYTVGGSVSGLTGTGLVLRNNGGDNLAVSANGTFTFASPLVSGATYAVTVLTQPGSPTQTCSVSNGSGTIGAANVTNVVVSCTTNTYTVGGSVTGLTGTGLVLRNNGGDNLLISVNGAFTFATPVASGATYAVTVFTQPGTPTQSCAVSNGSGTIGAANVTNVVVSCSTNTYTVGGSVSGLTGTGLVLRNNGGDNLAVSANGTFTFASPLVSGATYAVTVLTQPGSPTQTCSVSNGSGTIAAANVTNIAVSCTTNTYTVGGSVTGLTGTGLVLRNNGGVSLAVSANGAFTFATPVASGATYAVTVFTQPSSPTQTCSVSNGSGTIGAANVTNVSITCSANSFTVGGSVSGLTGTGLVLRNNGGDNLAISANGTFTFATPVASGATYTVTVFTQPGTPTQTCAISNGSGTIGAANVTNVVVSCTTNTYTVGGSVTGLTGTGLVLRNNGGDNLSISANGVFTFATPVASGATYAVTVFTQPSTPTQTCTVSNGGGTIGTANVTNVSVACVVNNTAPTITPAVGLSRQQGSAASSSTIATVSDLEQAAGSLVVTAPTVPANLTVSGITNSNGTVSASVAAACLATVGNNTVGLSVSDGSLSTAGSLIVNVTANSAPVLGTYAATTVAAAGATTVTPSAAPTDNGSVVTLTAAAPGFTGTFTGNPVTGVISISGAAPASVTPYVVTVTATDNCGLVSTRTFNLTVSNTANLDVSKDNGVTIYRAGDLLVYTLVLRNLGPDSANGAVFTDTVPATLINATWTCAAANGAVCPQASGSGSINATVATLPATGRLTYTLQANVATPTPAQISNTAQVSIAGLALIDPQLSNNSATDTDLSDGIFANGFEDPIVLMIDKANGQQNIALSNLVSLLDDTARIVFSAEDANGEALRVYGRINDAGEVELALAVRNADGLLRLGAWQRFTSSAASVSYTALRGANGFVLQSARFE